eukprot:g8360.t1
MAGLNLPGIVLRGAPSGLRALSASGTGTQNVLPYPRAIDGTIRVRVVGIDLDTRAPSYEECYATTKGLAHAPAELSALPSYIKGGDACSPYVPTPAEAEALCYLSRGLSTPVESTELMANTLNGQQAGKNISTESRGIYMQARKRAATAIALGITRARREELGCRAQRNKNDRD